MSEPNDHRPRSRQRKDRLVQTRVPKDLEATLKQEAEKRRLTVSHLVRNLIEDAFQLVDGVVTDVDQFVNDSVTLARSIRRSASGGSDHAKAGLESTAESGAQADAEQVAEHGTEDALSDVYAWNEVVLHRAVRCAQCNIEIARGERAYAGLSDAPSRPRAWLCTECVGRL